LLNNTDDSGGKKMEAKQAPEPFYSMARRAGDLLFLSGFGPVNEALQVVGATIEEQTLYTMDAIRAVLEKEGATFANVVRVNVFLLNMADRDGFNTAYMRYFAGQPMPTRRLIGAGDLYKGILVEIDCIAYVGQS
jgi:enamine deaminase RidA (YjgF/YER057c/UK114 family)